MNVPARSIGSDPRWELAQRIANSSIFSRSPALRRFLLFICESALQGQETAIKEQQIGHHVLGRPADYNAAEDNIVRVRARELRRKLEEYFKEEGKDEPVVILLPKGGYVPIFEARRAQTRSVVPEKPRVQVLPWAVSVVLALACAVLIARELRRATAVEGASPHNAVDRLWSQLIRPSEQTLVVAADSNFVILQDVARKSVSLDDYINQKYLTWPEFRNQPLAAIATRQYTGIGEVHVLLRILRTRPDFPPRIRFRFTPEGTVLNPARMTVFLNGILVQDNTELDRLGPGHIDKAVCAPGPLLLQDHGGSDLTIMKFRNIWVRDLTVSRATERFPLRWRTRYY